MTTLISHEALSDLVIKLTLYALASIWVFAVGALTLLLTNISSQAAMREAEHDRDEELGEE